MVETNGNFGLMDKQIHSRWIAPQLWTQAFDRHRATGAVLAVQSAAEHLGHGAVSNHLELSQSFPHRA
jgi:hypothetical protein